MKFQRIRLVIVAIITVFPAVFASDSSLYKETYRDYTVLKTIHDRVDESKELFDEEELIYQLGLITKYEATMSDDPQAVYLLNQSKQFVINALQHIDEQQEEILEDVMVISQGENERLVQTQEQEESGEPEQPQIRSISDNAKLSDSSLVSSISKDQQANQIDSALSENKAEDIVLDNKNGLDTGDGMVNSIAPSQVYATPPNEFSSIINTVGPLDAVPEGSIAPQEKITPYADVKFTIQELYDTYGDTIDGEVSPLCVMYYDQINQIAKRNNFPTSLIIAMRYREHSCFFDNPHNGWGNFQITSHYYEPGEITWPEFAEQIQHYIDFSKAKRSYYDNIQKFGPEPVSLSYDHMDINSIRKHAILYNGVYPDVTLESSRYSNENFTQFRGGRDGVVAKVLKVIQREIQHGKK